MKGKLLIAAIAFSLTLLGLVASNTYPIWMIGTMLIVLLGISSYMIEQRFSSLLVPAGHDLEEAESVHTFEGSKETIHMGKSESNALEETVLPASRGEESEAALDVEDPLEKDDIIETVEELEVAVSEPETAEESLEEDSIPQGMDTIQTEEDESEWFIENTEENGLNEVLSEEAAAHVESEEIVSDLSEIESMLSDDSVEDESEPEDIEEASDEVLEDSEDSEDSIDNEELHEKEEVETSDEQEDLEDLLFEEGLPTEELDSTTDDAEIPLSPEEAGESIAPQESESEGLPERPRIMREVMKTMIEQISLSRNLYSSDQMENMIKHYLHPSLHDQDYYTFSRILMDHYISSGQFEDLEMFIKGIRERFKAYPYIQMDLEQTNEYAVEQLSEIKTIE